MDNPVFVNGREQFFLFPQNRKFLNTFLVLLIIPIKFDLPRSGDSYIITKPVNFEQVRKGNNKYNIKSG